MIQQWFLEMPDKLGKLLAEHDATIYAAGLPVKSDEERERLERKHEKEFLRSQGNYTEEVRCNRVVASRLGRGASADRVPSSVTAALPPWDVASWIAPAFGPCGPEA